MWLRQVNTKQFVAVTNNVCDSKEVEEVQIPAFTNQSLHIGHGLWLTRMFVYIASLFGMRALLGMTCQCNECLCYQSYSVEWLANSYTIHYSRFIINGIECWFLWLGSFSINLISTIVQSKHNERIGQWVLVRLDGHQISENNRSCASNW